MDEICGWFRDSPLFGAEYPEELQKKGEELVKGVCTVPAMLTSHADANIKKMRRLNNNAHFHIPFKSVSFMADTPLIGGQLIRQAESASIKV